MLEAVRAAVEEVRMVSGDPGPKSPLALGENGLIKTFPSMEELFAHCDADPDAGAGAEGANEGGEPIGERVGVGGDVDDMKDSDESSQHEENGGDSSLIFEADPEVGSGPEPRPQKDTPSESSTCGTSLKNVVTHTPE